MGVILGGHHLYRDFVVIRTLLVMVHNVFCRIPRGKITMAMHLERHFECAAGNMTLVLHFLVFLSETATGKSL